MAYLKIEDGDLSFTGTSGIDTVFAGDGDDTIEGMGGDDVLSGGGGSDVILGGDGNDTVHGGDGDDFFVHGGKGADFVFGGNGDDRLFGGQGFDFLVGGGGNDTLSGDRGADTLIGNDGDDAFLFEAEGGQDEIGGFGDGDIIIIRPDVNGSGIHSAADALARLADDGEGGSVLDLGDGNTVVLSGVPPGDLTIDDFLII